MIDYYTEVTNSRYTRQKIAKRLHHERIRANLSLDRLSEITGYSKPTVQRWEKGWKEGTGENVIPTLDQLLDLCTLYECSPSYLLCEHDTRTRVGFDAELQLGLTEDSIKTFQQDVIFQLNTLRTDPATTFMCFLNFLLKNMSTIRDVVLERGYHEHWEKLASKQPGIEVAREALRTPEIQHIIFRIRDFRDTDEKNQHWINELKKLLSDYYDKHRPSNLTTEYLVERTIAYCGYVHPNVLRQNDFALSDAFLDVVRRFFANYEEEMASYNQFVLKQQQKIEDNNPGYRDDRKPYL